MVEINIGIQVIKEVKGNQVQVFGVQGAKEVKGFQAQILGVQGAKEVENNQVQYLGVQGAKEVENNQVQGLGVQGAKEVGGDQFQGFGGLNIIYKGNQKTKLGVNLSLSHYRNSQEGLLNISRYGISIGSNLFSKIRKARENFDPNIEKSKLEKIINSKPSLLNRLTNGNYLSVKDLEKKIYKKLIL